MVASNVKDGEPVYGFSSRINALHVDESRPNRTFRHAVPSVEGLFRIRMRPRELTQPLSADDVHYPRFSF
jgi:hypothetical protein